MQEKVNLPIVRQGYVCEESQYYMIGATNPKSIEKVPCVATMGKRKIFCARVRKLDSVTKSLKYYKSDKLPEEVVNFLKENQYNLQ